MLTHLSTTIIESYCNRTLSPEDKISVFNHIATCEACRIQIDTKLGNRSKISPASVAQWENLLAETDREFAINKIENPELPLFSWLTPVVVGITAVVIASSSVWIVMRSQINELQTTINKIQQENISLQRNSKEIQQAYDKEISILKEEVAQLSSKQPIVEINDGNVAIKLSKEGLIKGLSDLPRSLEESVKNALVKQELTGPTALLEIASNAGKLMSVGKSKPNEGVPFALVSPIGTLIQSTNPTFQWEPLKEAVTYRVSILNSQSHLVDKSEQPLSTTKWVPDRPLKLNRGEIYSWQVTAIKANGQEVSSPIKPAPQAKFAIIDEAKLKKLQQEISSFSGSHLIKGITYTQNGLLDDAEKEFKVLLIANPNSDIIKILLKKLKEARNDITKNYRSLNNTSIILTGKQ